MGHNPRPTHVQDSFSHPSNSSSPTDLLTLSKRHRRKVLWTNLWIDELPEEIRNHIAKFLTCGIQTKAALHLAEISPIQRPSILSALSYRLVSSRPAFFRWASVFADQVRHIELDVFSGQYKRCSIPSLFALLQTPTLRTARVLDKPELLRAVANYPSLRSLSVIMTSPGPYDDLLRTLGSLQLVELHLICKSLMGRTCCPFGSCVNLLSGMNGMSLLFACRELRVLEVCGWCVEISNFRSIVNEFPELRELLVNDCPAREAGSETVDWRSVVYTFEQPVLGQTRKFRETVTSIHVIRRWRCEHEVFSLASLVHLARLTLPLDCAKMSMINWLPALEQLRSIEFERVFGTPRTWSTQEDSV